MENEPRVLSAALEREGHQLREAVRDRWLSLVDKAFGALERVLDRAEDSAAVNAARLVLERFDEPNGAQGEDVPQPDSERCVLTREEALAEIAAQQQERLRQRNA